MPPRMRGGDYTYEQMSSIPFTPILQQHFLAANEHSLRHQLQMGSDLI